MEKGLYTIFHLVLGLPLALIGLVGSIVWYHSLSTRKDVAVAGMYLGPVILGMFCVLLLIWSLVTIFAAWRTKEETDIDI
jgi:uncharacterized membrane protein